MLRPEPSLSPDEQNGVTQSQQSGAVPSTGGVDIQQELNKLEELILANPRIPFTGRTLVDEDQLLDQLDLIRLNLPHAFREATEIMQQREAILSEARRYAEDLVVAADQEAAARLDELAILRQAETLAQQIKGKARQECEQARTQMLAEIEQMRTQAQQEWESVRQRALDEKNIIQNDADNYADNVLSTLEQQLTHMLRTIQNGRSQLQSPFSSEKTSTVNRGLGSTREVPNHHRSEHPKR